MNVICSHYKKCDSQVCGHKSEHPRRWSCKEKCTTKYTESRCINVKLKPIMDVNKLFEEIEI